MVLFKETDLCSAPSASSQPAVFSSHTILVAASNTSTANRASLTDTFSRDGKLPLRLEFRGCLVPKKILQYPLHQIFGHMHKVLNVVEKKN